MNLVVIHYHLLPSGVTRVISLQLRALDSALDGKERMRVVLLHGGRDSAFSDDAITDLRALDVTVIEIPELAYDLGEAGDPERLVAALEHVFADQGLEVGETVVHVHNHSLGKNASLPIALRRLACQGHALLLQVHDFAEDFRPDDYRHLCRTLTPDDPAALPLRLYPQSANIHYAVLNGRDRAMLLSAGVRSERLHQLANPVLEPGQLASFQEARRKVGERLAVPADRDFVLYPVRCIRRKNIGETLLWAALAENTATFGFTLAPKNPQELPTYLNWKALARSLGLPCVFETGEPGSGLTFSDVLAAADRIITTSVTEGFGMVFLEAWLARRPLVGRDLPEITADFKAAGVNLADLQATFKVPVSLPGENDYKRSVANAYRRALDAYLREPPSAVELEREIESLVHSGCVDFGSLTPELQCRVLRAVNHDDACRARLRDLNPWIDIALSRTVHDCETIIGENAAVIRERYSLEASGERMWNVLRGVAASPRDEDPSVLPHAEQILDAFLDLDRFHPLRVAP